MTTESVYGVWLITKGGICLARASYRSFDFNESLISGFLSAVSSFGENVVAAGDLHSLRFGFVNMILVHGDPLCAIAGATTENELALFRLGTQIQESFMKQYSSSYQQGLETGTFSSFEGFKEEIDRIIGSKRLSDGSEGSGSSQITEVLEDLVKGKEFQAKASPGVIEVLEKEAAPHTQGAIDSLPIFEGIDELPLGVEELLDEIENRTAQMKRPERVGLTLVQGISSVFSRRNNPLGEDSP